jgi:cytochrome c oxidase subunit 2
MRAGRPRRSGLIGWALLTVAMLLLAGCANADLPQDFLSPEGRIAREQDALWDLVFPIAVGVFVFVQAGLIFVMWRFRGRGDDTAIPHQLHGNTRLELIWTIIPALILAGIAVPTIRTIFDLAEEPEDALQVRVIGKQFWWEFEYLGDEGREVVTANELHIPTDRPVFLRMEALSPQIPDSLVPGDLDSTRNPQSLNGVIHSFWVPKLAGKQDVVPGHIRELSLEADSPGVYSGQCAEFCGIGHALMRFIVVAHEPADFEQWLAEQAEPAFDGQTGLAAEGRELFEAAACITCHAIEGYESQSGAQANVRIGPNLTHFASRRLFAGALFENEDAEQLAAWLADPQDVKQGAQMPDLGLTEDQIAALVAYLQSLE